jgi:galactonate dehydratase
MNATEDVGWLDTPNFVEACVERVKMVKANGLECALDFHGRLHKPMAKQLAKALEPHRPLFIEEPLLSEHPEAIKVFSQNVTTPIALGERLYSRWDIKPFLEASSVDVLQPDVSHVGGISEIKRIANMAEAYDVGIAPHCPLGPIALAASIQVAASISNFVIQEMSWGIHYNLMTGPYDLKNYLKNPEVFAVKDGHVAVPTGPGLGIELDEAEIRKISVDCKAWRCLEFHGKNGEIREW